MPASGSVRIGHDGFAQGVEGLLGAAVPPRDVAVQVAALYGGTEGGGCMIGSQEWLAKPGSEEEIESKVLEPCRARLAGHQVPRAVDIHPSLPRTETGKLLRRAVRAPYWEGRERRI